MPYSHHSHSGQFCQHGQPGLLEEVVLEAIRQGFELFGLTEHVPRYRIDDLYPEEEGLPCSFLIKQFDNFLDEAHRLRTLYADRITLLVGCETEFLTGADLDELDRLLIRCGPRIHYLVGSIHHVNGIPIDFDRPTFHKALDSCTTEHEETGAQHQTHAENFLCKYFDAQYELLVRFRPEVVGHIDLCRLFTPELQLAGYPEALARLERNVVFATGYGALFELNAAAFRKGWETAYPGKDVVELILKHGGRFTLSDDSHGPQQVGLNYDRLANYANDVGIRKLWYLRFLSEDETPLNGGRSVSAVEVDGNWLEHLFWNGRFDRYGGNVTRSSN